MNAAKFLPPRPMHVLDRERLMSRLLLHEDKKLVIVHAQAGQGKSVLASEYVRSLSTPFLWFNMDREDDNPAVFLSCLAEALKRVLPGHGDRIPALAENITAAAARNGLAPSAACLLADITVPLLIVFDDLNSTSALPPLMRMLALLIESSPGPVRFMIVSRSRPALELSVLRAKRGVAEITGNDLRFSDSEAYELFSSVFGMQLPLREAARINRSAEGWPAALVLMQEYLASGAGTAAEGHGLKRLHAPVFEYLAHEVFLRLPDDMQRFLLRTSVPEYLPAPLASRLAYPHDGGGAAVSAMIEQLLARNVFVTALNEERSVIRYHALFRDFLREKLRAGTRASELAKLHSTAAAYFTSAGNPAAAIDLLVASGQQQRAIRQIERCAPELVARGQAGTLLRWRQSLPADMRERPWFLFSRALATRFTDPQSALVLFDRAFRTFSAPGIPHRISGRMQSLCGVIEACFHAGGDFKRLAQAAASAQRLIARSPGASPPVRARLLLAIGMAWFFLGRLERSRSELVRALQLFTELQDRFYQITCAIYLTPCVLYQGDFRLAREVVRKGFEAQAALPEETASRAALFLIRAMTALFEGDFTEAGQSIEECKGLSDEHALESIGFLCVNIGGWIRIAQGDYRGAERMLAEGKRRGQEAGNRFFSASAAHLLAIAYLFQNRLAEAKAESDYALGLQPQSGSSLFRAIYLIASGVIHFKSGRLRQAEKQLLVAVAELRRLKAAQQEANARLALAMLYERKNLQQEFREQLQHAFSIGQERGFTYYALLTSQDLVDLARRAVTLGICSGYAEALIEGAAFAPRLRVRCLGGFAIQRGGRQIPDAEWKSPRAKELFKLLACHDRGKLPREQIVDALWRRALPRDPRGSFNAMLHRLRKTLDPSGGADIFCIEREGDVIALNHRVVWSDVRQFQTHLARAERLKSGNRTRDLLEEYQRAIDLYRGDFLPEDTYADWTAEVRDRLRTSYLQALAGAAGAAEATDNAARAQQFYEKIFSADPCSERACRWLMVRYVSAGQRREAVRTYEQCERALSRDMDTEPEENTKKLYRSIIGG